MSDVSQGPGWWQASDGKWYPPQGGAAPPPAMVGAPRTNSSAVISLILGIVGLVACGPITGIPAIILASSAKRDIRASQGQETGEGMATAGQILGWIATLLVGIALIAIIAITFLGESASVKFSTVGRSISTGFIPAPFVGNL